MILNSLKVQNYKLLKDFEVERLGRVNLIVGKNNSGKSTVLESLRIFASKGNPSVISNILEAHDGQIMRQARGGLEEDPILIYERLFTGRKFSDDVNPIYIGSISKDNYVEMNRVFYEETEEESVNEKGNIVITKNRRVYEKAECDNPDDLDQVIRVFSNQNPDRPILINSDSSHLKSVKQNPISYIPAQFLSMDLLASLWDKAVLTPYVDNVRKFLTILSKDFEDIAFIQVNNPRRKSPNIERTGIVKLANLDRPVPLNDMGDGVLRILQFVLGIFPATNGFLLIDEFENGLHFSVQTQIWKLIFELASELNIQVFATTHSRDCVEAFSIAAAQSSDEGILFRIGKSILPQENAKTIATIFGENSLKDLTQSDVELR